MSQVTDRPCEFLRPLVDLSNVEQGDRALTWDVAVRNTFPGLSVKLESGGVSFGSINCMPIGSGQLFQIDSEPALVSFRPPKMETIVPHFSLMVQSKGTMVASQAGQVCMLGEGDLCMIDEAKAFRLTGEERTEFLLLRLPRAAVLSRYPHLERVIASTLSGHEPGTKLLSETLLRLASEAGLLQDLQRSAMMNAIIHMLGVAEPFLGLPAGADWRVRRALDYIELNLSVAGLTAEVVAQDQHISRRRLDQLMHDAFGHSIASHLWSRRLEQAAADLRDPHRSDLSIAQIAFANGFEDAAHFTRAFKRKYRITPGQWRLN